MNTKIGRLIEDGSNKSRGSFRVSLVEIVHCILQLTVNGYQLLAAPLVDLRLYMLLSMKY